MSGMTTQQQATPTFQVPSPHPPNEFYLEDYHFISFGIMFDFLTIFTDSFTL